MEALFLQLSTRGLAAPYNKVPRRTLLDALHALTATVNRAGASSSSTDKSGGSNISLPRALYYSFRILQRLVTGVGVRHPARKQSSRHHVSEKDFSQVLNAFSNAGQMQMAHKIVALQERTPHAPPVSPVAYSILLKGYGRLRDLPNVERVLKQASRNQIQADTVMLNSLMDAFINCNAVEKAKQVFDRLATERSSSSSEPGDNPIDTSGTARPNRRTYNTLLKGYAKQGDLLQAQALASEMKALKLWDSITTNTLVSAAVVARDWEAAERVLERHTLRRGAPKQNDPNPKKWQQQQHPNVEAYTELLDGYAKEGWLDSALTVLTTMQERGVPPNEVTYTCLLGGLGRIQNLDLARHILGYMESSHGIRPTTKSYNALISGLVEGRSARLDARVDQAMGLLREMMKSGVRPDAITVSVLVEALGRCKTPRLTEAKLLVDRLLERKRKRGSYIMTSSPHGDAKVLTSLVHVLGRAGDAEGALQAFRRIQQPDTVAVNALLDAGSRCGRPQVVTETFRFYFKKTRLLKPDVVSYTAVIGSLLQQQQKKSTPEALRQARNLYVEMKNRAKIRPDNVLVDTVLKAMLKIATAQPISRTDVLFIVSVIRDADLLEWEEGQLERRKRAVRAVLADQLRETWTLDSLFEAAEDEEDELFLRKGWNKVDSGFRLWGGGQADTEDQFLRSHGWNDVDSGFRLF